MSTINSYLRLMNNQHTIIIAGAGGIAEAAGLLLMEWSKVPPTLYIGNRTLSNAKAVARWIEKGTTKKCEIHAFTLLYCKQASPRGILISLHTSS